MSDDEVKRLMRPHIRFKLVLKTTVAKQLYGIAMRMVNSLTKLTLKTQRSLPPDQAKEVMAASFEIIAGLKDHLENEQAALQGHKTMAVTVFPVQLTKIVKLIFPNTVFLLKVLLGLDKLAQQWSDLWFLGEITEDDFEEKIKNWRHRFRRASIQINALSSKCHPTTNELAEEESDHSFIQVNPQLIGKHSDQR